MKKVDCNNKSLKFKSFEISHGKEVGCCALQSTGQPGN